MIRSKILRIAVFSLICGVGLATAMAEDLRTAFAGENLGVMIYSPDVKKFKEALRNSPPGKLLNNERIKREMNGRNLLEVIFNDGKEFKEKDQLMLNQFNIMNDESIILFSKEQSVCALVVAKMTREQLEETERIDRRYHELNKHEVLRGSYEFAGEKVDKIVYEDKGEKKKSFDTYVKGFMISSNKKELCEKAILKVQKLDSTPADKAELIVTISKQLGEKIKRDILKKNDGNSTLATFRALGLFNFGNVTGKVIPSATALDIAVSINGVDSSKPSLLNMLDTQPVPLSAKFPYLSENVSSYGVMRFSIDKACSYINQATAASSMEFHQKMMGIINVLEMQLGFKLYDGLVMPMDTLCYSFNSDDGKTISGFKLKDSATMKKSLNIMATKFLLKESFMGQDLYRVNIPGTMNAQSDEAFTFVLIDGYLYYGEQKGVKDLCRNFSRGKSGKFYHSATYQELEKSTPAGSFCYSCMNIPETVLMTNKVLQKELRDVNMNDINLADASPKEKILIKVAKLLQKDFLSDEQFLSSYLKSSLLYAIYKDGNYTFNMTVTGPIN